MISGMPLETCWAFNKLWNNKFYYNVISCWLFLLIHTTMHWSMNIKLLIFCPAFIIRFRQRDAFHQRNFFKFSKNSYLQKFQNQSTDNTCTTLAAEIFPITAKHLPLIPLPVVDLERPSGRRVHEARWEVTWGVVWVPAVAGSCLGDSAPSG